MSLSVEAAAGVVAGVGLPLFGALVTFLVRNEKRISKLESVAEKSASFLPDFETYCKDVDKNMDEINNRLTQLETKVDLYWRGIEEMATKILHSSNKPHKDKLLEKYDKLNLTEAKELYQILNVEMQDKIASKDPKLFAYTILLNSLETFINHINKPGQC